MVAPSITHQHTARNAATGRNFDRRDPVSVLQERLHPMKQLQVLIRSHNRAEWSHGMIAYSSAEAWAGMVIARKRGMQCKVVPCGRRALDCELVQHPVTAR